MNTVVEKYTITPQQILITSTVDQVHDQEICDDCQPTSCVAVSVSVQVFAALMQLQPVDSLLVRFAAFVTDGQTYSQMSVNGTTGRVTFNNSTVVYQVVSFSFKDKPPVQANDASTDTCNIFLSFFVPSS